MKKIGVVILILSLISLVLMGCPPEPVPEKVVAEQYRGIYINDNNDNAPTSNAKIEFTSNKMIVTDNYSRQFEVSAWTEGNILKSDRENDGYYGNFEDNKFMHCNLYPYTKQ